MTALAVALLAAAAVAGTAAYYCLSRAARLLNEALNEQAETDFDNHCDELLAIVHDTQPGRDENARQLLEEMWRRPAAARRNTGPRPRKEEL